MGLEPIALVSDIPADIALVVASTCGGAMAAAIGVLWRRQVVLEDRQQANTERMAASAYASADALNKLTEAVRRAAHEKVS